MSIITCHKCSTFIDTDNDCDAFSVSTDDCQEISLEYPLCHDCKIDYEGLLVFSQKLDQFTQDALDWVSTIGNIELLTALYQAKETINNQLYPNPPKEN